MKTAKEILADVRARHELQRPKIKLSTACVICGQTCIGVRPTDYLLVDPDDQSGRRIHTKCQNEADGDNCATPLADTSKDIVERAGLGKGKKLCIALQASIAVGCTFVPAYMHPALSAGARGRINSTVNVPQGRQPELWTSYDDVSLHHAR